MHSINNIVYISIVGPHVSDSGLHLSAAVSLPVQPSSSLSQNERSYTSKQPLEALESKRKKRKLQEDIHIINIITIIVSLHNMYKI